MMKRFYLLVTCLWAILSCTQAQQLEIKRDDTSYKFGLVNSNGKTVVPFEYSEIKKTPYGFVCTWFTERPLRMNYRLFALDGKDILPGPFQDITFHKEFIKVEKRANGMMLRGLYSFTGQELIPCQYGNMIIYKHAVIVSTSGSTLDHDVEGLYSTKGEIIVPCKYDIVRMSRDKDSYEMYRINQNEKAVSFVLFNANSELVVPFGMYQGIKPAGDAERQLYTVAKNGKWGLWHHDKEIIACQYDAPIEFNADVANVTKNGEALLIKNPLKDGSQILIAETKIPNKKKEKGPVVSRYPKPDSEVDTNIPVTKKQAETTFAFIIANENYPDAPVPYSLNDGRMFREYCQKTLGIPEKNINMYEDATFGNIITAVEKMKSIAEAYEGDASVIFYYAGHGFPDDKQATAYLLPIDGDASSITTTGYSLTKLYKEIASLRLKLSVVFLDACFSGAKREDEMLTSARGVAIKVKEEAPQGNMLVFSAAQGDETAHQLEEKHHGLFTYCLLKELQSSQGEVDLGTLTDNVTKQVKRQSVVINNKRQTPSAIPSQALLDSWRTMKLK